MPRPAKPFPHQGHYCTDRGGKRVKLCPVEAGIAEAYRVLGTLGGGATVAGCFAKFLTHAKTYYKLPNGRESKEVESFTLSFRELFAVAGSLPIVQLSREHLKIARDAMIEKGFSRKVVNQRIGRVKHAARWLAEEGLAPDAVAASLALMSNLKPHRSEAPEMEEVRPVPVSTVVACLPYLDEPWNSMVRLQWWSGLRPGEVAGLLLSEICGGFSDADPLRIDFGKRHKMAYRGRPRVVELGPQATMVLAPWLYKASMGRRANVFQSAASRSKSSPDVTAYNHAIDRAAAKALAAGFAVSPWTPNQLRHSFATRARAAFGLEAAGAAIGHAKMSATEVYAERDSALASLVARAIG